MVLAAMYIVPPNFAGTPPKMTKIRKVKKRKVSQNRALPEAMHKCACRDLLKSLHDEIELFTFIRIPKFP